MPSGGVEWALEPHDRISEFDIFDIVVALHQSAESGGAIGPENGRHTIMMLLIRHGISRWLLRYISTHPSIHDSVGMKSFPPKANLQSAGRLQNWGIGRLRIWRLEISEDQWL